MKRQTDSNSWRYIYKYIYLQLKYSFIRFSLKLAGLYYLLHYYYYILAATNKKQEFGTIKPKKNVEEVI